MIESYTLLDGVDQNQRHPDTFLIPTEEDKNRIGVGSLVKLGFLDEDGAGERMWVEVTGKTEGGLKGLLRNKPVFLEIDYGDQVYFQDRNIIDIYEE